MSKTAKFDRQNVVEKATNLYWQKGFNGTSMRQLQDVLDMRPGSIYSAFGSKEGLFKQTLLHYTEFSLAKLTQCRKQADSPIHALILFMKLGLIESNEFSPSKMCMLTKTIAELTDEHQELIYAAKQSLNLLEIEFTKLIEEAQAIGEVDNTKDAKKLARHVQVQLSGLRSYSLTSVEALPLEEMIEDIFKHYPF